MESEWELSGNNKNIIFSKGNKKIKSDIVILMPCGAIYVIAAESGTEMNIQHVHELLGHCDKNYKKNCKKSRLEYQVWFNELQTKKQKNVTKSSGSKKAKANCGRIYSDISTIKSKT